MAKKWEQLSLLDRVILAEGEAPAQPLIARAERLPEPKRARASKLPPLTERQKERLEAIERCKGLILEPLLARALERKDRDEAPGVTGDDVHELLDAIPQSALIGSQPKARSWIGPWLASLARRGRLAPFEIMGMAVKRASTRPQAHGNPQTVYLHPSDRRVID